MKPIFVVKKMLFLYWELPQSNQTLEPLEMFRESVKPNVRPIDILSSIVNEIFNKKGFELQFSHFKPVFSLGCEMRS